MRTDLDLSVEEMVAANTDAWLDLIEANPSTSLIFGIGLGAIRVRRVIPAVLAAEPRDSSGPALRSGRG